MHRCFWFAAVATFVATSVVAQAPPPPPFTLQLMWHETGKTDGTWRMVGRTVTRTTVVPTTGHTSPLQTTTYELSAEQMNAIIALVPAFPREKKLTLPPNPKATSQLSASLVVNGSVLAIEGGLPQATPPPELSALAALQAALEQAQPKPPPPTPRDPLKAPPPPTVG